MKSEKLYPVIPYHTEAGTTNINDVSSYAKSKGITYAQLRDANQWMRGQTLPNKSGRRYIINIPTQEGMYYNPKQIKAHNKNWVID